MTDTRKAGQRKSAERTPPKDKEGHAQKLSPIQARFCEEYLVDLNATQAAIRAGYSAKNANSKAAQLLAIVSIQTRISELMAARSERTKITADRVLTELAAVGFTNFSDLAEWGNDGLILLESTKLTPEQAKSVQSVKVKRTISADSERIEMEIKQHSKLDALEKIGRHLGMFQTNTNVRLSGADGGAVRTENVTAHVEFDPHEYDGLTPQEKIRKYFEKRKR